jgi:hypothetical protein
MPANKEEVMKVRGSRRLVRWLGLALAVAAFAAPSAQAVLAEGISGSAFSSEATTQPRLYADDLHGSLPSSPVSIQARLYADDLHSLPSSPVAVEPRGYAPINTLARPDLPPVSSSVVSASSSGFDWSDASIGGGVVLVLMGFGAVLLAARQTRRGRLSTV